ncbi:MAG: hypothetical protein TEF_06320 [Rhizobiales bacterium NRL2]|jgi:DNA repair ATPase RecN|nr:MAG: hypothetical protein TEF_06320 [Rhizobiales bacterium NRL2]
MNRFLLAGAMALLLALPAAAQSQKAEDGPAADANPAPEIIKVYDENTLKPEDIRACLKSDLAIADMETRVADYEDTLTSFRQQIADLGEDLDRRRKQIDGTDPEAVAEYNRRVDRHADMIDRYNEKFVPNLTDRRKRLNEAIDTYNRDCAEKAYFEEDWLEAVAELGIEDPRATAGGGK